MALYELFLKVLVMPPQEQQAPSRLLKEIFVQAAVQAPVLVEPSSSRP
jgi:hypothetical protein